MLNKLTPGPLFGQILKQAYEAQLDGGFSDLESGLTWIKLNMKKEAPPPIPPIYDWPSQATEGIPGLHHIARCGCYQEDGCYGHIGQCPNEGSRSGMCQRCFEHLKAALLN